VAIDHFCILFPSHTFPGKAGTGLIRFGWGYARFTARRYLLEDSSRNYLGPKAYRRKTAQLFCTEYRIRLTDAEVKANQLLLESLAVKYACFFASESQEQTTAENVSPQYRKFNCLK